VIKWSSARKRDRGIKVSSGGEDGGLLPDADSVGRGDQQPAAMLCRFGMGRCIGRETLKNHRYDLGVVMDLQGYDSEVLRRRIRNDVREIAVQREQYCVEFLRAGNDNRVRRFRIDVVAQAQDLMTLRGEVVDDGVRDAVVREEPQTAQASGRGTRA
jgi:hypothetical protein